MSDHIVKLIPDKLGSSITEEKGSALLSFLQSSVPADQIEFQRYESTQFIDCGSNLNAISCPVCGAILSFEWWSSMMEPAFQNDFQDLSITLPCCGGISSLHDLQYDFPCGFSDFELDIWNPSSPLSEQLLSRIQQILGYPVRIIPAHL